MLAVWFKGHKDKEARKKEVQGYQKAFDELKRILEAEYKPKPCFRDYSDPNWQTRQIAVNEYNAVLEDILKLINIKE